MYCGFALASTSAHALLLLVTYSAYYAIAEPSERALVAQLSARESRATAYSLYRLVNGVAAMSASILFGFLWERLSPAAAFGFGAAMAVAGLIVLVLSLKLTRRQTK